MDSFEITCKKNKRTTTVSTIPDLMSSALSVMVQDSAWKSEITGLRAVHFLCHNIIYQSIWYIRNSKTLANNCLMSKIDRTLSELSELVQAFLFN